MRYINVYIQYVERSLDPFYIVIYYVNWAKTFRTYSNSDTGMVYGMVWYINMNKILSWSINQKKITDSVSCVKKPFSEVVGMVGGGRG